jgi:hypothetical protein
MLRNEPDCPIGSPHTRPEVEFLKILDDSKKQDSSVKSVHGRQHVAYHGNDPVSQGLGH